MWKWLADRLLPGLTIVAIAARLATSSASVAAVATTPVAGQPPASVHETVLELPGDPIRPITLQATLFTPEGSGPFPLAVLNHGTAATGHAKDLPRQRASFAVYYFLSRGYAVLLPMMRGYGGSGGHVGHYGCDLTLVGLNDARDIAAAIDGVSRRPEIDASRIVVAGQSFGGWNTLALGTLGRDDIKGLLIFAGGLRESDCLKGAQDASLASAAGYFGSQTHVPALWFYGDNDKLFPKATWEAMYASYREAGGQARLVDFGKFLDNAHKLLGYPEGLSIWTPKVDAFLAKIGLPAKPLHPEYLPTPFPSPTHYAAIGDVAAVPYLSQAGRAQYSGVFLHQPLPRAFVISPSGVSVVSHGGFDSIARALGICRQHAAGCQLYAVDNDVVWTGPKPVATERIERPAVSKTVPAGATTTLALAYAVRHDCSPRGITLLVTHSPVHGVAVVVRKTAHVNFPTTSAYAVCDGTEVPGAAVEYTPQSDYTGSDLLIFEEITPNNLDIVHRVDLTVR